MYKENNMELNYQDNMAKEMCEEKESKVVSLVHTHVGLASAADVSYDPNKGVIKIETAGGAISVDPKLTKRVA